MEFYVKRLGKFAETKHHYKLQFYFHPRYFSEVISPQKLIYLGDFWGQSCGGLIFVHPKPFRNKQTPTGPISLLTSPTFHEALVLPRTNFWAP